jgi:hypothetical protein
MLIKKIAKAKVSLATTNNSRIGCSGFHHTSFDAIASFDSQVCSTKTKLQRFSFSYFIVIKDEGNSER